MHHRAAGVILHAAGVILHAACFHISGVVGVVAMERFRDSGGDQEHPVQVVLVLTQRLAGEEFPGDKLVVFRPPEVSVQINALTGAVVSSTEDTGLPGDLPAIFPMGIQEKIFIREVPHALQPVLQLLEYLLGRPLACVLLPAGVLCGGLPFFKSYDFHSASFLTPLVQRRHVC